MIVAVKCRTLELSPACFMVPETGAQFQDWTPHIPYLGFLIHHLNPKQFVEVGVLDGNSYFAACATIKLLGIPCACYAVDPWEGEFVRGSKSGAYSGAFLESVRKRNEKYPFSWLMRKRSLDAAPRFADGSIDLLHIDASHAVEDVRADFNAWLPKVSKHGVILMHDALNADSGVPDFLRSVSSRDFNIYKNDFGFGLATILKKDGNYPEQISQLVQASPEEVNFMDAIFESLGAMAKHAQRTVIRENEEK